MFVSKKRTTKQFSKAIEDVQEDKHFQSRKERLEAGKLLRDVVPRALHAAWKATPRQRDPVELLEQSNLHRHPELVPVRYGRMLRSPFTFLRGSAGLMARDLATLPSTGIRVQACGDCHLLNFGLFATPERNLIFDINDFDETLPAPWEWDVKRLAVSFAVAAQDNRLNDKEAQKLASACVGAYRKRMRELSEMSPLDVWYDRLDGQALIDMAPNLKYRKARKALMAKARTRIGDYLCPQISDEVGGRRRLVDQPPILFHVHEVDFGKRVKLALEDYRNSLLPERRVLYDRYRLEDFAVKAVGIGSVGTFCFVGLFFSADNNPLLLQFKEACPSVLAAYAGKSEFVNQGQRVVTGQRLSQSASDIFLGWTESTKGRHFFVRQLRDMKMSFPVEGASFEQMNMYAEVCGMTLARAHAKSSDAALISGYLGKSDTFDQAIGKFALAYAVQNTKDYLALIKAEKKGRIKALREDD